MTLSTTDHELLPAVVGVDAGGTKTAAVLATPDGLVLARRVGGPANWQAVGRAFAEASLRDVLTPLAAAAAAHGRRVVAAAYGLSGLDRPADRVVLDEVVGAVNPAGSATLLVNDTFCILRAGTPDGVGVAVVSGTGPNTVGWGPDGTEHRLGGVGSELGDFGGGGDIGAEALRAARRGHDGRGPATSLHERIRAFLGVADLLDLVDWMVADSDRHFSPSVLAPLVFAAAADGDAVALGILRWAGEELGLCARLVAERLFRPEDAFPLVMGGSVLQRGALPVVRDAVVAGVQAAFPAARPRVLSAEPVCGAVLLALDRAAGLRGGAALPAAAGWRWPDEGVQARLAAALRLVG